MHSNKRLSISDFKFGIELEANVDTSFLANVARDGWEWHWEHCGAEIKSPILHGYSGLMEARRQIKAIWSNRKSFTFADCGLHVHIDIQDFNLLHLKRLLIIARSIDDIMFAMMDGTRLGSTYCRRMHEKSFDKIVSATNLQELQTLSSSNTRYDALNTHAFPKHGTIEFRYCHGTYDWRFIYSLISFYLRIVALAKSDIELKFHDIVPVFLSNIDGQTVSDKEIMKLDSKLTSLLHLLQMKGPTEMFLTSMFHKNVRDFKHFKTKKELKETAKQISFSMKG